MKLSSSMVKTEVRGGSCRECNSKRVNNFFLNNKKYYHTWVFYAEKKKTSQVNEFIELSVNNKKLLETLWVREEML